MLLLLLNEYICGPAGRIMEDRVTAPTASYVAPKTFTYVPPAGEADGARRLNMWKSSDGEQKDSAKYLELMAEKERTRDKGLVTTFCAPVKPPVISERKKEQKREAAANPGGVYEVQAMESKVAVQAWEAERDERAAAAAAQAAKRKAKRDKKKSKKKAKGNAVEGDGEEAADDIDDADD